MSIVRIVRVTYHPTSSRVSTNELVFEYLWRCIVDVGLRSWRKVNAMNCILKLWVVYIVEDILGGDNSDLDVEFESC